MSGWQSGMPQMSAAFAGWKSRLSLVRITQSTDPDTGFTSESRLVFKGFGVDQPLSPEEVNLKPEGQRAWTWRQIHIEGTTLPLKVTDVVELRDGLRYRVMAQKDFTLDNYVEYHLVLDYQAVSAPT